MKKRIGILLVIVMGVVLIGCGKKEESNATQANGLDKIGEGVEKYEVTGDPTSVFDNLFENTEEFKVDIEKYEPKENRIDFSIDEFKSNMEDNVDESDKGKIDALEEDEANDIAQKKANLIYELAVAFRDQGINVMINETSGEMSLDSTVLFGGDSAVLSDSGKAFLDKFIEVYSKIIFSDKYKDFVSKILVEGHTAPVAGSTYESGLPLSTERAENVKVYCVTVDTGYESQLENTMEAVGLSNSKPVKDNNGNVNMEASRRVSFRFLVNID